MKATETTPRTGRTITLELDNLGNAALWQIYQIVTEGTGYSLRGEEEDAGPEADTDAATEIFLHVAETANARADGADKMQRDWIRGIRDEYLEIFGTDPEEDRRAREEGTDAPEEEPANEEPEDDDWEAGISEEIAAWRSDPANENHDAALEANATDTRNDPNNLYRAGVFAGLAEAAAWQIYRETTIDDINAITAGIYKAYGVAW